MATPKPEPGSREGADTPLDTGPPTAERSTIRPSGPPFFIVGCPRSGTTLLSLMLDAHPKLAVPPESHFIVPLAPRRGLGRLMRPASLEDILPYLARRKWTIEPAALRAAVSRTAPGSYPELVRAVFSTYAEAEGKPRWGDKTPRYVDHVALLAKLFPDALFIHLIRDGREVAASLAERRWGPSSPVLGAFVWRRSIRRARRAGRRLAGRYMELRLEDLVSEPERQLRRVCAFLGEDYVPQMLEYSRGQRATRAAQSAGSRHLTKPPTAGLRDWRKGLTARQQRAVEAVCRGFLAELGYPPAPRSAGGTAYAWAALAGRIPLIVLAVTAEIVVRYVPRLALPVRLRRRRRAAGA